MDTTRQHYLNQTGYGCDTSNSTIEAYVSVYSQLSRLEGLTQTILCLVLILLQMTSHDVTLD